MAFQIVGAVCVDCNERTFAVAEFADSEHFTELEALVVQLGPKECLVYATDGPEVQMYNRVVVLLLLIGRQSA